ncbi:hypothetical protein LBMAG53_36210 [Planctomycetota bacterium]|nr:hypothetical protein LBMAG53_36210 [Planctomycetota bacterium]
METSRIPPGLVGWGRKHQPHRYRNDVLDYQQHCVFFITEGTLRAQWPARPNEPWTTAWIRPRQAIHLPPGSTFTLSTPTGPYQGHFIELIPDRKLTTPVVSIFAWEQPVATTIAEIELEYARLGGEVLLPLLHDLLHRQARRQLVSNAGDHPEAVGRIDALLRAHVYAQASLTTILGDDAAQRRARRIYKAARGCSPKRALLDLKLAEAERLLTTTRLSITTIALDLGFPSLQHFTTQFRRLRGTSPSALRNP